MIINLAFIIENTNVMMFSFHIRVFCNFSINTYSTLYYFIGTEFKN